MLLIEVVIITALYHTATVSIAAPSVVKSSASSLLVYCNCCGGASIMHNMRTAEYSAVMLLLSGMASSDGC
jgi:hypothetical protein